jgi:Anti-sigma-K factor rskA/Putative zinc-finger
VTEHPYRELLGPHVLGELSTQEVRELERHLPECFECQEELADVRWAHQQLREMTAVSPPPALKGRVLKVPKHASGNQRRWKIWIPAATLALTAFLGGVLFGVLFIAISGGSGEVTPLVSTDLAPGAAGELLLAEAGEENVRVELEVRGLPELGEEEYYELWFVEDDEHMSGGTFRAQREGRTIIDLTAPANIRSYPEVDITQESDDGDPRPSRDKVLVGNLQSS